MKLTWSDLLIEDLSPDDCANWLAGWTRLHSGRVALAFMNKFGSWFLRTPEGPVLGIDVLSGTVERVAPSYDALIALVNQREWQERYLLSELVFQLHEAGKIPAAGECYAIAPHPALGGPNPMMGERVDPANVMVMSIRVWQSLCVQCLWGSS